MKKTIGFRFKTIFFSATIAALLWIPFYLVAQCTDCDKRSGRIVPSGAGEKEYYEKRFAHISECDPALDNPEDSTTKRTDTLDQVVLVGFKDMADDSFEAFQKLLVYLSLHDPYTAVRRMAVGLLGSRFFSKKVKFATLKQALNDPSLPVRVCAANVLLQEYFRDNFYQTKDSWRGIPKDTNKTVLPDQQAEKILRDAAAGVGRSTWNVKGLYSKEQFEENPGIIDSIRDQIQGSAVRALASLNIDLVDFLDSVSQHGKTEEIRKSAEKGKKLY